MFLHLRPLVLSTVETCGDRHTYNIIEILQSHSAGPFPENHQFQLMKKPSVMSAKSDLKLADAAFLLDAVQYVTSTAIVCCMFPSFRTSSTGELTCLQINAGEIASKKDAKVNTVVKRFSIIKQRYNLNIQTTSIGNTALKKAPITRITKKKLATGRSSRSTAAKQALNEKADEDANVKVEVNGLSVDF